MALLKVIFARFALATLLLALAVVLQGCGGKGQGASDLGNRVDERSQELHKNDLADCEEECKFNSMYGRWRSMSHGFLCWSAEQKQAICTCTAETERPADCQPPLQAKAGSSLAVVDLATAPSLRRARTRPGVQVSLGTDEALPAPADASAALQVQVAAAANASATPSDTVHRFCDAGGLREMRGEAATGELAGGDGMADLESKILGDIARELEHNNVDKMAKEIFSFYICVRWAPDAVFWKLAEQELPAQIAGEVLGDNSDTKEDLTLQGIAEMYKDFKFVPLLCSRNLEVFREMDDTDKTYFRKFAQEANGLTDWLKSNANGVVGEELTKIDQTFCGDAPMNTCSRDSMLQRFKDFFKWGQTTQSMFAELKNRIMAFTSGPASPPEAKQAWSKDFGEWKKTFPYHSFIGKPEGFQASKELSPRSSERFMVCFGKRVASDLHRRPNGQHILTDQNNIGCHGWYDAKAAGDQIQRMVKLWRPPTCQLAEMTYVMKKEILAKFQQMNERLFDSLPSIINDELEEADRDDKPNWEDRLPGPFNPQEVRDVTTSRIFVDGMRVRFSGSADWCLATNDRGSCRRNCELKNGDLGTVHVVDQQLRVEWLGPHLCEEIRSPKQFPLGEDKIRDIQIMPDGWQVRRSIQSHVRDLVAGLSTITDKAQQIFNSMFKPKQTNLADLMSGSVSKWAVCPIKDPVDLQELDSWLGVEDAAFRDFQMEAYKKWTGFQKEIPGEKCVPPAQLLKDTKGFEKASVCEINELHADHVERYTNSSGQLEAFTCPLRPPLPADEQLTVLEEKKATCFLRMTGRQEQQFGWHYQGFFPARRQNDRKDNLPRVEFELVSLLKVPGDGIKGEVSFGRYCSMEELQANPRFCNLPVVRNMWDSMKDFANNLAQSLVGVSITGQQSDVMAPLGVGASAVTNAIASFQEKQGKNFSEHLKDTAVAIGEKTWDEIRGAGRLLRSTGQWVVANVKPELPGTDRMTLNLDERFFGTSTAGEMLHSMSFQRSIGSDARTSNAKERFQRFVVSYPCPSFDPALQFGMRRQWNRVALRLVHEAYRQNTHRDPSILDKTFLNIAIRGEGFRYMTTAERRPWYNVAASMVWRNEPNVEEDRRCQVRGDGCFPANQCKRTRNWLPPWNLICTPYDWWTSASSSWWPVNDDQLVSVVAPLVNNGNIKLEDLLGFEMAMYCAPKKDFGASGEPTTPSADTLRQCLEKGVQTNALLRAREPWKLYFPEEVVVVAIFTPMQKRQCRPRRDPQPDGPFANETDVPTLCRGAEEDKGLAGHLLNAQGFPHSQWAYSGGTYMGLHAGAGFPKGILEEVVMRPEDVLEALQLISGSNGR